MTLSSQLGKAISALLLAVALLFAPSVAAQTITNVAGAKWTVSGRDFTTNSNPVSFDIQQLPVWIDTYVNGEGNGDPWKFTPSDCGTKAIVVPGGAPGGTSIASLHKTNTIRIGNILYFRLIVPKANVDPEKIDQIKAILTTQAGDREELTVYETAPNSGEFMGAVPTSAIPPQPVRGDCKLSVSPGDAISIECLRTGNPSVIATARVEILADPFGLFFDSEDGTPIDGVTVTLIDVATGAPAKVFADDGATPWPSTVISGASVTDGAGNVWPMLPGEYRFPLAALGQYRLVVTPPAPYSAPSKATPGQLALLRRPDGGPLEIVDASFGGTLTLATPAPVRVDVPLDRPPLAVSLSKYVSKPSALPGDVVFYTITARNQDPLRAKRAVTLVDSPSSLLRLRQDSIRIDGAPNAAAVQITPDGRQLTINLGDIAPGATRKVTYGMTVRANAPAGQAVNKAVATDSRGLSSTASAVLKIGQDDLAARMTLIGQVTSGDCTTAAAGPGIPGVRVLLEDGSFAITDADGRYHFEGLSPGSHVVQVLGNTLPKGGQFIDCARSVTSAGSASSRFIAGQGGSLVVANFVAKLPQVFAASNVKRHAKSNAEDSDKAASKAAGSDTDWLTVGDGPTDFLFPAIDHNPRAPAVRVVIRHRPTEKIELLADGAPVEKVAFDGTRTAASGAYAVSIWRAIPLIGDSTRLTAIVRKADGSVATTLTRDVHFVATPARIELLPDQSRLIADGTSRPVLALRVLDRNGRPVHDGISGEFNLSAPYESAEAQDAMQSRALTGQGRSAPRWTVKGDEGIALVELAPTMVSGKLHMEFSYTNGQQQQPRRQQLDAWVVPGDQPWTLIGLAEGSLGARSVADNMERTGRFDSDLGDKARIAFYAKGKVLGKYLLTMAYDSAKQRDNQRLLGAIDPRAYYTVFADGSERRFDAASREKLYVRIESSTFYALYGDFDTGFNQTQLARYQRVATGLKAEVNAGGLHAQAFAAKAAASHRHDEIQGGGISGPYRLSSRAIIANSEQVQIETRDRLRSELVLDRRRLIRFIDYDIDLLAGTITFKEPVLSRDASLNPQFIVIDYETDDLAQGGKLNAGLRADYTTANNTLRVGISAITDTGSGGAEGTRTDLAAVDLRAKLGESSEVRAELGLSRRDGAEAKAWLVEAEHRTGKLDVLAYARSADQDYGVGQMTGAERGRQKFGLDARLQVSDPLALTASTWYDDSLGDAAYRFASQLGATYRTRSTDARLGLAIMRDHVADGRAANSTVLEGGLTRRMADNRLELGLSSAIALDSAEAVDLPARHRLAARYALTPSVKLVGTYEIAKGKAVDARTARAGVEVSPWSGARMVATGGQQDIAELGKRSFAAFGLSQSLTLTKQLTVDATLDSSKTLGGIDAARLINRQHPASSGGNLGEAGTIAEDFTAVTLGATWREGRWTATARGELRNGQLADRKGVTAGLIRQLGEGSTMGSGFVWTKATASGGATSEILDGAIAVAHRPANSAFAFLGKVQFRSDSVTNAVAGEAGPAGRTALTVNGDARARRLIGGLSANWSPQSKHDGVFVQRTELGLFAAVRHNFDRFEGLAMTGTTLIGGVDARLGLSEHFDLGAVATVRHGLDDKTTSFAFGPQIGISPAKDVLLTLGYNISGFRDRDFAAARNTDKGLFATLRMKIDADSLSFLGLGR